ncbi:hypothetical protein GW796_10150 [archaeon]|nr:hypothetical protein [archaeon]
MNYLFYFQKLIFTILLLGYNASAISDDNITKNDFAKLLKKAFIVSAHDLRDDPSEYGGYLFFESSFQYIKKDNNKDYICNYKKNKPNSLFFIDHEGGSVNRINSDLQGAKNFKNLTQAGQEEYYKKWNTDISYLKSICMDVILSSAVDTNFGSRSFSNNLEYNLKIKKEINTIIEKYNLIDTIKHFPGNTGKDLTCKMKYETKDEVYICASETLSFLKNWEELKNNDLLMKENIFLMISNYIYPQISPQTAILDLSNYTFLRKKLSYNGFLISDAISEIHFLMSNDNMIFLLSSLDLVMIIDARVAEQIIENLWTLYLNKNIEAQQLITIRKSISQKLESLKIK